jgi:hypothetical protein
MGGTRGVGGFRPGFTSSFRNRGKRGIREKSCGYDKLSFKEKKNNREFRFALLACSGSFPGRRGSNSRASCGIPAQVRKPIIKREETTLRNLIFLGLVLALAATATSSPRMAVIEQFTATW